MAGSDNVTSFFEKHGSIIIITFLVFISVLYISSNVNLQKENCTTIKNERKKNKPSTFYSFNELRNANYFKSGATNNYNCKLKDFYFKSAYNCFCSGIFVNDYVDPCAVKNCAEMGVRFLDMQVFSLNKLPIIAANHDHRYDQKSTYNHIDFDDGMKTIKENFVKGGDNKNKDTFPLFLHLRLNYASKNIDVGEKEKKNFYNQVHDTLIDVFDKDNKLFTKNQRIFYNNYDDSREQIIANLPIEDCEDKVFIFITLNDNSSSSENFKKSKLNQITDLLSKDEQSLVVVHSDEIVDDNYI